MAKPEGEDLCPLTLLACLLMEAALCPSPVPLAEVPEVLASLIANMPCSTALGWRATIGPFPGVGGVGAAAQCPGGFACRHVYAHNPNTSQSQVPQAHLGLMCGRKQWPCR